MNAEFFAHDSEILENLKKNCFCWKIVDDKLTFQFSKKISQKISLRRSKINFYTNWKNFRVSTKTVFHNFGLQIGNWVFELIVVKFWI